MKKLFIASFRTIENIIKKARKWNWSNIITLLALLFTVYQNKTSDDRYNKNMLDSDKSQIENNNELKRIRKRDSLQSFRDSLQTNTLINEYHTQLRQGRESRKKDSVQLTLFSSQILLLNKSLVSQNEALDIQNKSFEIQRLSNKSDLSVIIRFNNAELVGSYASLSPATSVTNIGKTDAQNIVYKSCVLVLTNWKNNQISCNCASPVKLNNLSIAPGEYRTFGNFVGFGFKFLLDSLQTIEQRIRSAKYSDEKMILSRTLTNNIKNNPLANHERLRDIYFLQSGELDKKYQRDPYKYFCVVKISYQDKYQSKREDIYSVVKVNPIVPYDDMQINSSEKKIIRFFTSIPAIAEVDYLKNCLKDNGYDYDKIVKIVNANSSEGSNSINY